MSLPYVNIHTHSNVCRYKTNSISVLNYSITDLSLPPTMPFSVGLHPWDVNEKWERDVVKAVTPYAILLECIAIGEIGLDYSRDISISLQKSVFEKQLELASNYRMPVVLHVVKAYHDILRYQKSAQTTWILHAFKVNESYVKSFMHYDTYFSLGIREIIIAAQKGLLSAIPLSRLFLETDDSAHTIDEVYDCYISHSGHPLELVKKCIFANYCKVFNIE